MSMILTASGVGFDFLHPDPALVNIEDIAHALANLCRFTGHTSTFYSVAQHSVGASHLVPEKLALEALLHDASEAYLGDVSTPLKALLPKYRTIERGVQQAICRKFGVQTVEDQRVKAADMEMLRAERRILIPRNDAIWPLSSVENDGVGHLVFPTWAPVRARAEFLKRFNFLTRAMIGRTHG